MPIYILRGETYDIPEEMAARFESENPSATRRMAADGSEYDIPVSKLSDFRKSFPQAQPVAEQQPAVEQPAPEAQGTVAEHTAEPQQPTWKPTPVQDAYFRNQLAEVQRSAQQTVSRANERIEDLQSINPMTMQGKPRVKFNHDTGKVEMRYPSMDGTTYATQDEAVEASRKYMQPENMMLRGIESGDMSSLDNYVSDWYRDEWQKAEDETHKKLIDNYENRNWVVDAAFASNGTGLGLDFKRADEATNIVAEGLDVGKMSDAIFAKIPESVWMAAADKAQQELVAEKPDATVAEINNARMKAVNQLANHVSEQIWSTASSEARKRMGDSHFLSSALFGTSLGLLQRGAALAHGTGLEPSFGVVDQWNEEHPIAGTGAFITGMLFDPLTYISGGMGKIAGEGALKPMIKKFVAQGLSKEAAERAAMTSLRNRIMLRAAQGAGNFATYETGMSAARQFSQNRFDAGEILGSTVHGAVMGGVMGFAGGWVGNKVDKAVQRSAEAGNKGAAYAKRALGTGVEIGTEIAIFAAPDAVADVVSQAKSQMAEGTSWRDVDWGNIDYGDAIVGSLKDASTMVLGFKLQHAAGTAIGMGMEAYDWKTREHTRSERLHHKGVFKSALERMIKVPETGFTEEERAELQQYGYDDLADMSHEEMRGYAEIDVDAEGNETVIEDKYEPYYDRVAEMLQDERLSETARAKMAYIITGKRVPMSAVTGSRIGQTEDGRWFVDAVNVRDGVVSHRVFDSEKEATGAARNIDEQAQANVVDIGEHLYSFNEQTKDVWTKLAEKYGMSEAQVKKIVSWAEQNGDRLGDVIDENGKVDNKILEDWHVKDIYRDYHRETAGLDFDTEKHTQALREEMKASTGIDIDEALAKDAGKRSEAEKEALSEYIRRLYPEEAARDESADGGTPDFTRPQLEYQAERTPYERGREAQPEERRDIVLNMRYRGDAEAQEAYNGMVDRINEDADAEVQRMREEREQMQYLDGSLRPATLKMDDKPVYIVDGNVQMFDDGSMVDLENSDQSIVVFNPESGKREMISPESILRVEEPLYDNDVEATIEQHRNDYIQQAIDEANGKISTAVGSSVAVRNDDGSVGQGVVIANMPASVDEYGNVVQPSWSIVQLENGEQLSIGDDELQRVADDIVYADWKQRNGMTLGDDTAENGTQEPAQEAQAPVAGAQHDYEPDAEIVIRDDEDGQEKRGIVQGRVRYDSQACQFIPDPDGQMIEYYVEGEGLKHDYPDRLDDKVVSYKAAEKPAAEQQATVAEKDTKTDENYIQNSGENIYQPTEGVEREAVESSEKAEAPTGPLTPENAPILDENKAQVAENEEERQVGQPEADAMPMTADEEPDYYATTPERAHSFIYDEAGLSRSEANEHVAANYDQAQKDLVKAKAASMPKMGTSIKKFNEAKAQRQQKIEDAEKRVSYWQAVRDKQQQIVAAEQAERAAREAEQHDAAVAQVAAEREAAKQAEAERKAVGNENPMPAITEKWNTAVKRDGAADEIVLPNGKAVSGHYVLHESGASSPSHQATAGFKQTDGFPMDVNDNTVNDRDYEHDTEAQRVTEQIAQKYDQRALQTPVVVSKDGVVLSGNGRTMAGELAAQAGTDGAYIDYLKKHAGKYGFTPEQVEAMQHPRVSFVPDEDMPYTADTFSAFNQQEMKSLSKTEQSVKLGKTVPDDTFNKVVRLINGFDTLSDFYGDTDASYNAIVELNQAGVIPQAQMAEMMDGHKLSAVGREMLENMLIGKSFESDPDAVRRLTAVPSMHQSVIFSLAEISNNLALGEGYSLQKELADAIKLCYEARTEGKYDFGEPVSSYARQLKLFAYDDEMQTVADINNATTLLLADVLNDKRVSQLKRTLVSYNNQSKDSASGQMDMFTGGVREREDILKDVLTFLNNGTKQEIDAAQQSAIERRKAEAASVEQTGDVEPGVEGNKQPAVEPAPEAQPEDEAPAQIEQSAVEAEPAQPTVQQSVETASAEVNTEPTPAQKEAGNYKKGHVKVDGYNITIENPKGSVRRGTDANGKAWENTMNNTYGYIRGTEGVDGDHIDVFLSDEPDKGDVFVVDQYNPDGTFDEHKVMYGFASPEEARAAYLSNYSEGWENGRRIDISHVSKDEFKKWVDSSHRKTKAFADYARVQKETDSREPLPARNDGYTIERRNDITKKGADGYAVNFNERVSKDEFKGQCEIAKQMGGWYSRGKGFVFKSEDAAHDFAETVMGRSVEAVEDEAPISIEDVAKANDEARRIEPAPEAQATVAEEPATEPQGTDADAETEASWPKAQYREFKAKYPDALILFNDGEGNYAAYENDAEKLSSILGTGLASLNDGTRLAGFPAKALDAYLPRLIRAKQRVAICDQLDEPKTKKKVQKVVEDIKPSVEERGHDTDTNGTEEPRTEREDAGSKKKSKWVEDEDAERFEELRKRLHEKLYGQLNMGFDPETFALGAEMSYLMLKKGARKIGEFAKAIVELMGDAVRPHIKSFYDGARHMMSEDIQKEMSSHEDVDAFDAFNFDKKGAKDLVETAAHIDQERRIQEVASLAEEQIKDQRNEEKRNKEKQVAADTKAVVNEAETVASEVESKLEATTTEEDVNDLGRQVDAQLEKIDEQLALLGYYEAEPIQRDYNEAYGYMRNAERQAHKDVKMLFDRLCEDLGLNLSDFSQKDANGKRRKFIHTNIAPAGGDITMRLPLDNGVELYVDFIFEPEGDNLRLTNVMYRPEKNGNDLRANNYFSPRDTYDQWLHGIKTVCKEWLPQEDYVAMAQRIAKEAEHTAPEPKPKKGGKKTKAAEGQLQIADLFGDFFDTPAPEAQATVAEVQDANLKPDNNGEKEVHVQPRASEAEREGGHEPRQDEPLGESEQHEAERPDGSGVDRRDAGDIEPDAERSGAVSGGTAEQAVEPAQEAQATVAEPKNTRNNRAERGVEYAPKGENARIEANIKAIETMQRLMESGEYATPEDMEVLRRFSGWGGLGAAFKEKIHDSRLRREWQKENPVNQRLRSLLTPEQYSAANMSRNSAYYTPTEVIEAMWDVASALGFKGGNVLEGSAGIGNIIGLMPQDMSERSDIHAVEIDDVTGNILKLLYPDAKVDVQGFEKTSIPNGSVDLAITNVPFVTGLHVLDETGDKDLSKKFRDIHDFCIAKNVRKLREGGIGIFITSSGTLDNSQKLRNWLVNEGKSDVVGAFRMHNKTFGGTGATSDIIVVRKRVNGQKSANAIDVSNVGVLRTAEYVDEERGRGKAVNRTLALDYNQYFIEHPENMAGEMRFGFEEGDTFRPTSKALYPSKNGNDQGQMLREWADGLSKMDWDAAAPTAEPSATVAYEDLDNASDEPVSEGSMFLNKKGELCIAQRGQSVPLAVNANKVKGHTKAECFTSYKGIKDALAEVLEYQTKHDDDAGLQPLIKKLNAAYDAFVKTYGHLNKNTAISFLRNDMDYPSIAALESVSESGTKDGKRVVTYGKTDIFSHRVVEKESEPKPTSVKDGVITSIYLHGKIDLPYIVEALGHEKAENWTLEDVKKEIIESGLGYENPVTGDMEVSYEYLSGNVREKLHQAQANNADGRFDANVKALERVIPMNIPAHLIDFSLGSSWIEPKLYEDFVKERTGLTVGLRNVGGTWMMKEPYMTATEQNKAMGIMSDKLNMTIYGHQLIEAALQNKTITVSKTERHYDGTTETVIDKEATQACANRIDEIRQDFKDWARGKMQADPEMSQKMETVYNEQFNNYVPKSIPDEFVPEHFGGAARVVNGRPFQLRPHQAKAAIRATTQPLMLAHEVGTGKTYTLITTAMEMRRLGTARKPMIVVQNATVGQFVASAKALYPNAKILTLEDADRNADGRRNFYAKIRYNDWDMIVVPQSVFERIPDSEERQAKFVEDKIEEKLLVLEQMKEAAGDNSRDPNVRQAEREIENLRDELNGIRLAASDRLGREKADNGKQAEKDEKREAKTRQNAEVQALEMLDRAVDDVANFDDMGIDALLIDEAHEYKHLGFATAMQRGVKGVDPSYSKKSQGVYLKTQAVLENNNGRNVVFATGTPISNTAAEIWTFMRYLMTPEAMKDYGMYYFDDFVRNFGNIQNVLEFGASGKYKPVNRFLGYFNLPELVRIWAGVADTVLTREAGGVKEKIPDMEGGQAQDVFLPQTRALRGVMKYVKQQLEDFENMSGKEKKENSHIPLVMFGIAKAAAVDVRLVESGAPDEPSSKTNETVRQTLRSLKETEDYKGTVAIFADNYQNKHSGFNLYEDIREKLIAAGVPAEQIVVMKSGMTVKKKLEIFDRVNRGEVRVVMGSTFTLGTGVNIQERLHTLIHVDAPNRPMDYTQRNGRILRQGNMHRDWNKPVRVLRFGVEDSLDVTAYQRLKTKGAIADSIMEGKKMIGNSMENRSLEEEQDIFGDITAQLSGSQYALLKNQIEKEVRNLESKYKQWQMQQTYIHNQKPRLQGQILMTEERVASDREALAKLEAAGLGHEKPENGTLTIKIGGQTFSGLEAMGDYIKEFNKKQTDIQDAIRASHSYDAKQSRTLVINVGGIDFVVNSTISKFMNRSGADLFASAQTKMTYSCPELGLENVPVNGQKLRSALEDILGNVVTGNDLRERIERANANIERYQSELAMLESQEGKPFTEGDKLEAAKKKLAEYDELMQKEMQEKEAKYAEVDADVEAATGVELSDEDDDTASETGGNGGNVSYRMVDDVDTLDELEQGEKVKVYRAMQVIDGKLYPPMAAVVDGELVEPTKLGRWYRSDERPDLIDPETGTWKLNKGQGKGTVPAAYNPYFHTSFSPLNDQFSSAYIRPNLVIVECEVPKSELTSGYKAQYAKDAVGEMSWHSGSVSGALADAGKPRRVVLSRFAKVVRIVPNSEVADVAERLLDGVGVQIPYNVVTPQLRKELEKRGIEISDDASGTVGQDTGYGKAEVITDEQIASLNKQMQENATTEPEAKRAQADNLAKKYGVKVTVVDDVDELGHEKAENGTQDAETAEKMKKAKGWYDHKTGEIVVVLPNNRDVEDVAATMLHETVAHKGLRELIGEDGYSDFLREVYSHCNAKTREKIGKRAAKHGWNFEKATDEYLGELGEKGFEDFDAADRSIWQMLKEKVLHAIDKFLKSLKLPKWVKLGDNELRYMLWRSHKNLQRGREGVIEQAQDIVMRKDLKLGELSFREPGETEDIWSDASMGFAERMTAAATRLASNHQGDKRLKNDAMRAIGSNIADLRKAMSLQRTFDMTTVKRVGDLARILMDNGFLKGLNQQEVKRLLAAVKNSVGHEDIDGSVQKVMDIMIDNQLHNAKETLNSLMSIKGSKVDAKGVEVQGQLDPDGTRTMRVFKNTYTLPEEEINKRISEAVNSMSSADNTVADAAAIEYTGLNLALDYVQNIAASVAEEKALRDELATESQGTDASSKRTDAWRQYVDSMEDAIRQNKTERVEAYYQLVGRMSDALRESLANAAEFREAEKQRVREIQHNANSDMQGRPSDEHHKVTWKERFVNNWFVQLGFAPLATFDQMLRMFGSKSASGEGYLWNRFMRGWVDAREQEINGVKEKYAILDAKAAEVFRGTKSHGTVRTWGDLIRMESKMPKASVSFWNGGEMQERELTQGNLLYIYMVNKMLDGRIKLRKMGITEQDVDRIVDVLDPRFVQLADWLQDEFLVDTRNEYNETHKRMFGASMAAIENYFPLKILANARADKPEDLDNPHEGEGITTTTGSIIKRRRNALALDITNADAFSVILDHVTQMEHWNAYAEWNRDLNTLRTYRHFRNQVQNMNSIYGGGEKLWKKFNEVCQMAAGSYRPKRAMLDEAAVNFAKGVTAAKVSFRVFTALKQLLSMPAYIPEVNIIDGLRNPAEPFGWCLENLPVFKERWQSRMSGDPRLLKSDMDWKMWRSRIVEIASRVGMSPNAFVDALTVSIGAKAMYETKKAQYLKDGYDEEQADRRAKQDATILFNETQQSSEGPFTATMQVDRSWLSVLFTVFRNAAMSYQRQLHDALRNMRRNMNPKNYAETIAFMKKQMERDGIDSDAAQRASERKFKRQLLKDVLRIATFGSIMQLAWNLGAYLPYILFGDDEDEKQKMWDDVWTHTMFGSIEGLTGGDVMSQAGNMLVSGEGNPAYLTKDMPLASDITAALKKLGNGKKAEAFTDLVNIIVQSGIGVNPQSIMDTALAIMDACGDDPELAHEAAICIMRILQVPQSQIDKMYFDEVGLSGDEVSQYTPAQLAERYARYKVKRGNVYSPWSWNDEETIGKQTKKADTAIKERLDRLGSDEVNEAYERFAEQTKELQQVETAMNKAKKTDLVEAARLAQELQSDPVAFKQYKTFKALDSKFDKIVGFYLNSQTADEANLCKQAVIDFKAGMVKVLQTDGAEQKQAMDELTRTIDDFLKQWQANQ